MAELRREMSENMREELHEAPVEFFERCLPRTFSYFRSLKWKRESPPDTAVKDDFDAFIGENFLFFGYFIRSYYRSQNNPVLKLASFVPADRLSELDALLLECLTNSRPGGYRSARNLFAFCVEQALVDRLSEAQSRPPQ